jgi:hypothetical protein
MKKLLIIIALVILAILFIISILTKNRPITYDVTDWGAIPNDTIDDSEAISAAINAARYESWRGAIIYFPPGVYIINSLETRESYTETILTPLIPGKAKVIPAKD